LTYGGIIRFKIDHFDDLTGEVIGYFKGAGLLVLAPFPKKNQIRVLKNTKIANLAGCAICNIVDKSNCNAVQAMCARRALMRKKDISAISTSIMSEINASARQYK